MGATPPLPLAAGGPPARTGGAGAWDDAVGARGAAIVGDAASTAGPSRAGGSARFLVHGMGAELVDPDWPPLTPEEIGGVLAQMAPGAVARSVELAWLSPRPFSAAVVVTVRSASGAARRLVLKRHHASVRTAAGVQEEHAWATHLARGGVVVPLPLGIVTLPEDAVARPAGGGLVGASGPTPGAAPSRPAASPGRAARGWTYEVLEAAEGLDLYRERHSWTPYLHTAHARAAGRALARLHEASSGYTAELRRPAPLMASSEITSSADLVAAIARFAATRPGLAAYLRTRSWREDVARSLAPWHEPLRRLAGAPPLWCHGDWHPSNLLWSTTGRRAEATAVIDFGLCNRASARYDLATAIERSTVRWLDPAPVRSACLEQVAALIDGYRSVRALERDELGALAALLPLVHVEYALSEVEYFHHVLGDSVKAGLAYDDYLLGHADWFAGQAGGGLLAQLRAA